MDHCLDALNSDEFGKKSVDELLWLLEKKINKEYNSQENMRYDRHCARCQREFEHDCLSDGAEFCIGCGIMGPQILSLEVAPSETFQRTWRKKSVYKHTTYAKNIIDAMLGDLLPTSITCHKTLLQLSQVGGLLQTLSEEIAKSKIAIPNLTPAHVSKLLRGKKLGKYYKYRVWLCERLNPSFKVRILTPKEREILIKNFSIFAKVWMRTRSSLRSRSKNRKNMPHVSTVVKTILDIMSLDEVGTWLVTLKSKKRQEMQQLLTNEICKLCTFCRVPVYKQTTLTMGEDDVDWGSLSEGLLNGEDQEVGVSKPRGKAARQGPKEPKKYKGGAYNTTKLEKLMTLKGQERARTVALQRGRTLVTRNTQDKGRATSVTERNFDGMSINSNVPGYDRNRIGTPENLSLECQFGNYQAEMVKRDMSGAPTLPVLFTPCPL